MDHTSPDLVLPRTDQAHTLCISWTERQKTNPAHMLHRFHWHPPKKFQQYTRCSFQRQDQNTRLRHKDGIRSPPPTSMSLLGTGYTLQNGHHWPFQECKPGTRWPLRRRRSRARTLYTLFPETTRNTDIRLQPVQETRNVFSTRSSCQ